MLWTSLSVALAGPWPDLDTARRVGGGEQDAAVVVSIEDYAFIADVVGAGRSGEDWYRYLTAGMSMPASRVWLLEDTLATRERILQAAQRAADSVADGGRVWFIFIGHGAPLPGRDGGALLGMDVQAIPESILSRGVGRDELLSVLSDSGTRSVVAFFDACFSGADRRGGALVSGLQPIVPDLLSARPGVSVLTASNAAEYAGPLPGLGRPAFSYLALGALMGWGDADQDGTVTSREVTTYAKEVLSVLPTGRSQHPSLIGDDVPLSRAQQAPPDLAAVRLALDGPVRSDPLVPETPLPSRLQRRARTALLDEAAAAQQNTARADWAALSPTLVEGSAASEAAAAEFVASWTGVTVAVADTGGRYTRDVNIPALIEAQAFLRRSTRPSSLVGVVGLLEAFPFTLDASVGDFTPNPSRPEEGLLAVTVSLTPHPTLLDVLAGYAEERGGQVRDCFHVDASRLRPEGFHSFEIPITDAEWSPFWEALHTGDALPELTFVPGFKAARREPPQRLDDGAPYVVLTLRGQGEQALQEILVAPGSYPSGFYTNHVPAMWARTWRSKSPEDPFWRRYACVTVAPERTLIVPVPMSADEAARIYDAVAALQR